MLLVWLGSRRWSLAASKVGAAAVLVLAHAIEQPGALSRWRRVRVLHSTAGIPVAVLPVLPLALELLLLLTLSDLLSQRLRVLLLPAALLLLAPELRVVCRRERRGPAERHGQVADGIPVTVKQRPLYC